MPPYQGREAHPFSLLLTPAPPHPLGLVLYVLNATEGTMCKDGNRWKSGGSARLMPCPVLQILIHSSCPSLSNFLFLFPPFFSLHVLTYLDEDDTGVGTSGKNVNAAEPIGFIVCLIRLIFSQKYLFFFLKSDYSKNVRYLTNSLVKYIFFKSAYFF